MMLLFLGLLGAMCGPGGMNYDSHGAQPLLSVMLWLAVTLRSCWVGEGSRESCKPPLAHMSCWYKDSGWRRAFGKWRGPNSSSFPLIQITPAQGIDDSVVFLTLSPHLSWHSMWHICSVVLCTGLPPTWDCLPSWWGLIFLCIPGAQLGICLCLSYMLIVLNRILLLLLISGNEISPRNIAKKELFLLAPLVPGSISTSFLIAK